MRFLFLFSLLFTAGAAAQQYQPAKPVRVFVGYAAGSSTDIVGRVMADRLGAYGDRKARTPAIDAFAKTATTFDAAFTVAPITLPAHATLFTGLLPPAHGVRGNGGFALPKGVPTLAEALRSHGLRTAAFVGGFPLSRRFGLARGFDHYDDDQPINVGTGRDLAITEVADLIAEIVGFRGEIRWDASKPDGTPRKLLDVQRLTELGWRPSISLTDGIRQTYDWFRSHQSDYRR